MMQRTASLARRAFQTAASKPPVWSTSVAAGAQIPRSVRETRGTVWLDGRWQTLGDSTISILDLSILRGYGVFDFMRTFNGQPFALDAHLRRLQNSANLIGLPLPWSRDELKELVDLAMVKDFQDNPGTEADMAPSERFVRLMVTGGDTNDWMTHMNRPTLAVMVTPCQLAPASFYENGIKTITFPHERFLTAAKTINYLPAVWKFREAKKVNAVEVLYTNRHNHLLEGSTSNLFFVTKQGGVVTAADEVLPGITRADVLLTIEKEGLPLELREVPLAELPEFEEAFITASNKMIMPVVQVDDTVIGKGVPGPVTRHIMQRFQELTTRWGQTEA